MALKITSTAGFFGNDTAIKFIQEYFGKVNSGQEDISIALMTAMPHWAEVGQVADFDEYIYVMSGELCIDTRDYTYFINPGEMIQIYKSEWVKFYTLKQPTTYIAICVPAFQNHLVKRDEK